MKVYIKNQQKRIKVSHRTIAGLLRKALRLLGLHRAELSILFVNDRRMRILNHQYRGMDKTTDVLSFPLHEEIQDARLISHPLALGDIVINLHKAKRQAEENSCSLNEELKRLLIHGLLHLIGYDHEQSRYLKIKMQEMGFELMNKFPGYGRKK
jgi:probable rRNA maturation factor